MLELQKIRNERDYIVKSLRKRGWSDEEIQILDTIVAEDDRRKNLQTETDALLAKRNRLSDEIGGLFRDGKSEEANNLKSRVDDLKSEIQELEAQMQLVKKQLKHSLLELPNITHDSVPNGKKEDDNELIRKGEPAMPDLSEGALAHWDLGKKYDILDFEAGVKITGAGFPVFKNKGARLQRALINFFLDEAIAAGYQEIIPPLLVNSETAMGTGQLPDKEGQMYHTEKDQLYLIPTSEVPLTNIYRGDILNREDLPIRLTAYTPCFRREAGSYGADVKGLNRVHQFDKIEIVQIQHPDESYETLDKMVEYVEGLLKKLELPYRILRLCGGDISFASALTYDFEVYAGAQKRWLEVSSVSNFETFQSNRMKLRFRDENGKTRLTHTLNGSALALARIVAAILENNQSDEGVIIPEALRNYTGFNLIT